MICTFRPRAIWIYKIKNQAQPKGTCDIRGGVFEQLTSFCCSLPRLCVRPPHPWPRLPQLSCIGRVRMMLLYPCDKYVLRKLYLVISLRSEKEFITLPRNIEDAKNLGRVLSRYKDSNYAQVLVGFFVTYILYPFTCCGFL